MKRIFISVGSEGLKAQTELLNRLCMENMFDKFNDYYIAFDSMKSEVDGFNKIRDIQNTDRIQGYVLTIDPQDAVVEDTFQPGWAAQAVPAGGVGGDRTTSMKAVSSIKQVWTDPNLGLDHNLQPDDHIIVVGSAFGGTSGGMFLNVCQYLDLVIRRKRIVNPAYDNVQVLGFLLMPEGVVSSAGYPSALNMIDMFRDLQTISWQRRLESDRPGFKVPVLAQYENGYFPLFTEAAAGAHKILEYGISGSSLPLGTLYLLPTPSNQLQYMKSLYAETLFVASYLRVDEGHGRWIDRIRMGGTGVETNLNVEDNCIAGFNMFAMKSGRMISLKNWFYKGIISALHGRDGHGGLCSLLNESPTIQSNIVAVFQNAQVPCKDTDPLAGIPHPQGSALNALLQAVAGAGRTKRVFRDFVAQCQDLLTSVYAEAPAFEVISAKELVTILGSKEYVDWNSQVNFTLIKQAYNDFYSDLGTESEQVDSYKDKIMAALRETANLIELRTSSRVVRDNIWGLSQENAVMAEIIKSFRTAFETLLRHYLFACRCHKTTFIAPNSFLREIDDFEGVCLEIECNIQNKLKELTNDNNPYISEGVLVDPLILPPAQERQLAFNPLEILLSSAYRTAVPTPSENKFLLECIEALGSRFIFLEDVSLSGQQVLDKAEENSICKFIEITADLVPAANPLSGATFANFADKKLANLCLTYAPELKVQDSDNFHYHFVIQQGTPPASFAMTNNDVAYAPLNISTMPGTGTAAAAFLSCNHGGVARPAYWKDENTAVSPIFQGQIPGQPIDIQGLWLGTLGINFSVRDILNKFYAAVPHVQADWVATGLASPFPRRLMTTVEMLRFGLIIEAIEEKVRQAWQNRLQRPGHQADRIATCIDNLNISFNNPARTSFNLNSDLPSVLGFSDDADSHCKLAKISTTWTGQIFSWLRDPGVNGFEAFFPMAQFNTVKNTENNIFTDIRFSINPSEIREMNIAKNAISASLQISGI